MSDVPFLVNDDARQFPDRAHFSAFVRRALSAPEDLTRRHDINRNPACVDERFGERVAGPYRDELNRRKCACTPAQHREHTSENDFGRPHSRTPATPQSLTGDSARSIAMTSTVRRWLL